VTPAYAKSGLFLLVVAIDVVLWMIVGMGYGLVR
jgi:hypothetical protein